MTTKLEQGVLPFKIEKNDEPLIARVGLVLPLSCYRYHFSICKPLNR